MIVQDALKLIANENSRIVYLSGKTSTGKSTFARSVRDEFGYTVFSLDDIVYKKVIEPLELQDSQKVFVEVYKHRSEPEWVHLFVTSVREAIKNALKNGKNVIIDGAVANPTTLKELFKEFDFLFLYFHPVSLKHYYAFLLNRFLGSTQDYQNELPLLFWDQFKGTELNRFYNDGVITSEIKATIKQYALISQQESTARLDSFKEHFADINVVEI